MNPKELVLRIEAVSLDRYITGPLKLHFEKTPLVGSN